MHGVFIWASTLCRYGGHQNTLEINSLLHLSEVAGIKPRSTGLPLKHLYLRVISSILTVFSLFCPHFCMCPWRQWDCRVSLPFCLNDLTSLQPSVRLPCVPNSSPFFCAISLCILLSSLYACWNNGMAWSQPCRGTLFRIFNSLSLGIHPSSVHISSQRAERRAWNSMLKHLLKKKKLLKASFVGYRVGATPARCACFSFLSTAHSALRVQASLSCVSAPSREGRLQAAVICPATSLWHQQSFLTSAGHLWLSHTHPSLPF